MNNKKQKLELTWIGKDREINLEPRILVEVPEKNYGDTNTENMLIHGDNLLALKALEQEYSGKIKCIYIDPPYNTGSAFEHYDDNVEHSKWLSLIKARLEILYNLLADDGLIFISIDNKECHYLKILCDEIFGRYNFRNNIIWKKVSSAKTQSHFLGNIIEYILLYTKSNNALFYPIYIKSDEEKDLKNYPYIEEDTGRRYGSFDFTQKGQGEPKVFWGELLYPPEGKHWIWTQEKIDQGIEDGLIIKTKNGLPRLKRYLDNKKGNYISDLWDDSDTAPISANSKEAFNFFGQKPEGLIKRIIELGTKEGDIILDSFLGSGTTAAVAHKMGRKWIGIELGDHCYTHCEPRLQRVVDGTDQGGISKAVNWQGGGGYKFYELAPSLLKKDEFGEWIIEPKYDAEMLAEAMAKNEGYKYSPDGNNPYKQGYSTEKDFIFTTTQFITAELLNKIQHELKDDESLLICTTHYEENCIDKFSNITVKKIPQSLLKRCEFGKLEYNLNVTEEEQPQDTEVEDMEEDV